MKQYLLFLAVYLFLAAMGSRIQDPNEPFDSFTRKNDYTGIEYIGNWTHMNQGGSFANTYQDTVRIRFFGIGIDIRTELMEHHTGYQVILDGQLVETVSTKDPSNTVNILTYRNWDLDNVNHVVELVPDGGYFVLNEYTVYFFAWPGSIRDTLFLPRIDTVTIVLPGDTVTIIRTEKDTLWQTKTDTVWQVRTDTVYRTDTVWIKPEIWINSKPIKLD